MTDDLQPGAEPLDSAQAAGSAAPALRAGYQSVGDRLEQEKRSVRILMRVVRFLFLVMLVTVTTLTVGSRTDRVEEFTPATVIAIVLSTLAVGVIVLAVDYLTPNKRLASTVAVYLGICVGLLGALAVAKLIDVIAQAWGLLGAQTQPNPYIELAKVVIGIVLCYLAVSFVLTTKDDFRLVIPYVEFAKQVRGTRPMVLDTSVLIDGRIEAMVQSGFVDAPLVIPLFVVEELQALSDSSDRLKRARGRRGLDVIARLQSQGNVDVSIESFDVPGHAVDKKLVDLANLQQMRILTTDFNLVKVARINGATALNLNDLAAGLKTAVVPGEVMHVDIVKRGENEGQGVGYMPDGTMVVVEQAIEHLGHGVDVVVTNSVQTSAGRLVFARVARLDDMQAETEARVEDSAAGAARAATAQPRYTGPVRRENPVNPRRNPRR
ncbi:MAG: PIN/TRAM domain-containing protein [Phycisphaeraceae bacterium]|nr:MAG: PIN/TRAM domain-containing protein [Phycisphaeraceae bacterium]